MYAGRQLILIPPKNHLLTIYYFTSLCVLYAYTPFGFPLVLRRILMRLFLHILLHTYIHLVRIVTATTAVRSFDDRRSASSFTLPSYVLLLQTLKRGKEGIERKSKLTTTSVSVPYTDMRMMRN